MEKVKEPERNVYRFLIPTILGIFKFFVIELHSSLGKTKGLQSNAFVLFCLHNIVFPHGVTPIHSMSCVHVTMQQTAATTTAAKHLNQNDKVAYLSRVMRGEARRGKDMYWIRGFGDVRMLECENDRMSWVGGKQSAANKYENIFSSCGCRCCRLFAVVRRCSLFQRLQRACKIICQQQWQLNTNNKQHAAAAASKKAKNNNG